VNLYSGINQIRLRKLLKETLRGTARRNFELYGTSNAFRKSKSMGLIVIGRIKNCAA